MGPSVLFHYFMATQVPKSRTALVETRFNESDAETAQSVRHCRVWREWHRRSKFIGKMKDATPKTLLRDSFRVSYARETWPVSGKLSLQRVCCYTKPDLCGEVWYGKLSAVSAGGACRWRENLQCKPSADWAEFGRLWMFKRGMVWNTKRKLLWHKSTKIKSWGGKYLIRILGAVRPGS